MAEPTADDPLTPNFDESTVLAIIEPNDQPPFCEDLDPEDCLELSIEIISVERFYLYIEAKFHGDATRWARTDPILFEIACDENSQVEYTPHPDY